MVEIFENWNNWSYISFKNAEAVLIVNKMTSTSQKKMQLSKHKVILANYKNTALKADRSKEELNLSGQSKQKKWSLWQLQLREVGKC